MFDNKDRFRNGRILRTAINIKTNFSHNFLINKAAHYFKPLIAIFTKLAGS